jgi:predicted flap endonuclease-1-like 5' DNA nuclease
MPHKKLERVRKNVTQKRAKIKAKRELRRRRVELNKPKTTVGKAKATVKQAKEAGAEAKKLASTATAGKLGGSDDEGMVADGDAQNLTDLPGVGDVTAQNLRQRGYRTPQEVRQASAEELATVRGVGQQRAQQMTGRVGGGGGGGDGSKVSSAMDAIFGEQNEMTNLRENAPGGADSGGGLPDFSSGGGLPDFSDTGGRDMPDFSEGK